MKDIIMPRYDPEMKTGRVAKWLKNVGDKVTKGEPVVLIDTEKVSVEVEAPESGTLSKILVEPPQEVPIGTPLGSIATEGEKAEAQTTYVTSSPSPPVVPSVAPQRATPEVSKTEEEAEVRHRVFASPAARRAARSFGIDLRKVKGSGPKGRITSEDVERFEANPRAQTGQVSEVSKGEIRREEIGAPYSHAPRVVEGTPSQEPAVEGRFTRRKLDAMRLTIANRMSSSWKEIPQVPLVAEVGLSEVEKFRAGMEKLIGKRVSLTAIVAKALASALRSFPDLNSRFESNEILEFEDVDVSIAVALEHGLITPVVKNANRKTASDISQEIEDLAARARSGKLSPSEVKGGTTTVSSLGGFGVDIFVPIINPPQVTIVGVGKSRTSYAGLPVCNLTLVFDHRATDGARAAQLLQKIKDFIESPYLLQMA